MKRRMQWALVCVLCLTVLGSACAAGAPEDDWTMYDLSQIGLQITFPDEYSVFARNMPENSPVLAAYDMTAQEVDEVLEAGNVYLQANSPDHTKMILVTMVPNVIESFYGMDNGMFMLIANSLTEALMNMNIKLEKFDIFEVNNVKFLRLWENSMDDPSIYGIQYCTVYEYQAINITLNSFGEKVTKADEALMEEIAQNAIFGEIVSTQ